MKIDLTELERLCSIQCTDQELASFFEVDVRTIERRKKKPAFAAALERGRSKGRVSVRRMLFSLAAKGNVAAAIFLAKNLLGYKDYFSNEHSGPDGAPIAVSVVEALHRAVGPGIGCHPRAAGARPQIQIRIKIAQWATPL